MKGSAIYSSARSIKGILALDLRRKFQMVKLTEVMRQRDDFEFIRVLDKIIEGNIDKDVEETLRLRFLEKNHILKMLLICLLRMNHS